MEANPNMIKYIKSGFASIDAEGGFRTSELVYVIGRKGDGKSVLLLNLAHNMWKDGHNVILFSIFFGNFKRRLFKTFYCESSRYII